MDYNDYVKKIVYMNCFINEGIMEFRIDEIYYVIYSSRSIE